jgi:hypothetical protein
MNMRRPEGCRPHLPCVDGAINELLNLEFAASNLA